MSASIGRSLGVLSVLLGCFTLLVIGGHASPSAGEGQLQAPDKQTPKATCLACLVDPSDVKDVVVPSHLTRFWVDGEAFHVKLTFTDPTLYSAFGTQGASLCLKDDRTGSEGQWVQIKKAPSDEAFTYLVLFRACRVVRGERAEQEDDRGTGTARIIVTEDRNGRDTPKYQLKVQLKRLKELGT
jgi:hypothetical protein